MKKYSYYFFIAFLTFVGLFSGCKDKAAGNEALTMAGDSIHFGQKIDESGAISYDSLLTVLASADSLEAKVIGTVDAVCQTKGCWMDLVSDQDTTAEAMFVQFKDYAFFMPKDLAGSKVVIEGKAYREITSVDDLKHFAEDEGLAPEEIAKITEPKEELKFMASGVKILK